MTRTWVVLGAAGMLGHDVVALLEARGEHVVSAARAQVDITDRAAVASVVEGADVVVNCAAWTAVDDAETREADAFAVNALGAATVAAATRAAGARLAHVSTDYVFDGGATAPYPADAPLAPRSAYGRSKAAGEWAVRAHCPQALVVRTAWLYGEHGDCFPKTIARLLRQRGAAAVVVDQVGQPTWTADVAAQLLRLVDADPPGGNYAAVSAGRASWFDFAQAIAASLGLDPVSVTATTTASFPKPAPRPAYSVLDSEASRRVGVAQIGPWQERWVIAAPSVLVDDRTAMR